MSDFLIGVYSVVIVKYNLFNEDDKVFLCVVMENVLLICSYIGMVFIIG